MPVNIVRAQKGVSGPTYNVSSTAMNTAASGSTFLGIVAMDTTDGLNITVSDTINGAASGNTWTLISTVNATEGSRSHVYKCENGNGGTSHVLSVSCDGSPYMSCVLLEIEGGALPTCIDQVDEWQSGTSTVEAGPVTTTQATELLIGIVIGNTSSNPTAFAVSGNSVPSTGWGDAIISELNGANYWTFAVHAQRVTSIGTYDFEASESGAPMLNGHLITVKEALPMFRPWDYRPDVQQIFHNPR